MQHNAIQCDVIARHVTYRTFMIEHVHLWPSMVGSMCQSVIICGHIALSSVHFIQASGRGTVRPVNEDPAPSARALLANENCSSSVDAAVATCFLLGLVAAATDSWVLGLAAAVADSLLLGLATAAALVAALVLTGSRGEVRSVGLGALASALAPAWRAAFAVSCFLELRLPRRLVAA